MSLPRLLAGHLAAALSFVLDLTMWWNDGNGTWFCQAPREAPLCCSIADASSLLWTTPTPAADTSSLLWTTLAPHDLAHLSCSSCSRAGGHPQDPQSISKSRFGHGEATRGQQASVSTFPHTWSCLLTPPKAYLGGSVFLLPPPQLGICASPTPQITTQGSVQLQPSKHPSECLGLAQACSTDLRCIFLYWKGKDRQ